MYCPFFSGLPLKLRLLHKVLFAQLSVILLLLVALVSINYIQLSSISSVLEQQVKELELSRARELTNALQQHFSEHGNWSYIQQSQDNWVHFVEAALQKELDDFELNRMLAPFPHTKEEGSSPPPPPPHRNPVKPWIDRLTLVTPEDMLIVKAKYTSEIWFVTPIVVDGVTVAVLQNGKLDRNERHHPPFFAGQQFETMLWFAGFAMVIASLASYLFTRFLTKPVKQLTERAEQLANRDFETKLPVDSNDELGELSHSLNRVSDKLARYEMQQKQWLQDIAHELRTPLTIIRGEMEALVDGVIPASSENLTLLQLEILRLNRLIDDLHELAITDNLELSMQTQPIQLDSLITTLCKRCEGLLQKRGLTLSMRLDSVYVWGDEARLSQVFTNLLKNCAHYTELDGNIWLELHRKGSNVQLLIEDSGPGVSDEQLDKLFQRLYRTDQSRNSQTGGAGLGLAICENIIAAHHGHIQAMHGAKGGLVILVTLPLYSMEQTT